jgi:hypothetical protein
VRHFILLLSAFLFLFSGLGEARNKLSVKAVTLEVCNKAADDLDFTCTNWRSSSKCPKAYIGKCVYNERKLFNQKWLVCKVSHDDAEHPVKVEVHSYGKKKAKEMVKTCYDETLIDKEKCEFASQDEYVCGSWTASKECPNNYYSKCEEEDFTAIFPFFSKKGYVVCKASAEGAAYEFITKDFEDATRLKAKAIKKAKDCSYNPSDIITTHPVLIEGMGEVDTPKEKMHDDAADSKAPQPGPNSGEADGAVLEGE